MDAPELKVVGKSGQISLGKRYAGKPFQVTRKQDGTVVLTPVAVIPESQAWVFQEPHWSKLQKGLAWATGHEPKETDLKGFFNDFLEQRPESVRKGRGARARP